MFLASGIPVVLEISSMLQLQDPAFEDQGWSSQRPNLSTQPLLPCPTFAEYLEVLSEPILTVSVCAVQHFSADMAIGELQSARQTSVYH